mgnify:FL=1
MQSTENDDMLIVAVCLAAIVPKVFHYAVPQDAELVPGQFVLVPFGRKKLYGVIWEKLRPWQENDPPKDKLKSVEQFYDIPPLSEENRKFVDWVSSYVMSPQGAVLKLVLSVPDALSPEKPVTGWQVSDKRPSRMTDARERVFAALLPGKTMRTGDLTEAASVSISTLTSLEKEGALIKSELPAGTLFDVPDPTYSRVQFSNEQHEAVNMLTDNIETRGFQCHLLDGVTGSGKTEVFFEVIAAALTNGKSALVLLPEIALTEQLLARFEDRFGCPPALWHSGLTASERRRTWRTVAEGKVKVMVAARSGLFLPWQDLGVIVVDEEHDPGFKQEEGVIYNARDMAVVRGRLADATVILSSATPSLESYVNARDGRYHLVKLPSRHGSAGMPDLSMIDMRIDPPARGQWLSPAMVSSMQDALDRGKQTLLFLNRRGYAPLTLCRNCGHRYACSDCDAWLVEHRSKNIMACHQCGSVRNVPDKCEECGEVDCLTACGPGVERVLEEVGHVFPDKKAAVLSSDMIGQTGELQSQLSLIQSGAIDIIIGTQIIAKGHHFPELGFAGVVDADLGLGNGDLRAAERTYQTLLQVSGRAGREASKGTAMLQSYMPDHPVLKALIAGERDIFLEREAEMRAQSGMPPFGRLAGLVLSGPDLAALNNFSRDLAALIPASDDVRVLGPAPAPIARIRNRYRLRFLIKAGKQAKIQQFIASWLAKTKTPSQIRVAIDIDPYNFL